MILNLTPSMNNLQFYLKMEVGQFEIKNVPNQFKLKEPKWTIFQIEIFHILFNLKLMLEFNHLKPVSKYKSKQ